MESLNIQNYISRLTSCGISTAEAVRTVCSFLKEFTESDLESFIESLEKDIFKNVD